MGGSRFEALREEESSTRDKGVEKGMSESLCRIFPTHWNLVEKQIGIRIK